MKHASNLLEHEQIVAHHEEQNLAHAGALSQEEIKRQHSAARQEQEALEEQRLREVNFKNQIGLWLW